MQGPPYLLNQFLQFFRFAVCMFLLLQELNFLFFFARQLAAGFLCSLFNFLFEEITSLVIIGGKHGLTFYLISRFTFLIMLPEHFKMRDIILIFLRLRSELFLVLRLKNITSVIKKIRKHVDSTSCASKLASA